VHADGTETSLLGPLQPEELYLLSAAISPDGSRVAYTGRTEDGGSGLYVIDVDSGRTSLLVEPNMGRILNYEGDAYQPTFSPDGTQIAFIQGGGDHSHSVWVVDVDGTDPHMIVRNDVTWGWNGGHVFGLAWSPTGDRIALGLRGFPVASIYTFTPNGSRFTRLIRDALAPSWSPDGSQIAFYPCPEDHGCRDGDNEDLSGGGLGVADADGSHAHTFGVGSSGPWHPA
jgi:TolB protein